MPKRPASRSHRPDDTPEGKGRSYRHIEEVDGQLMVVVYDAQGVAVDQWPVDTEGINYDDIPDMGDDNAYWTGGRIGPVLPEDAPHHPGGAT